MDEILKKIDNRIEYWQALAAEADEMGSTATMDVCDARVDEAQRIKEIFISQQKEFATDNNILTIGDKIRESNRSLAYMLGRLCSRGATDIKTFEMRGWTTKKWLDYLNQPYME